MTKFIFVVLLGVAGVAFGQALHLSGRLTATDQEAQECYFGLGKDIMVTARPGSEACDLLRGMVNRDVNLSIF